MKGAFIYNRKGVVILISVVFLSFSGYSQRYLTDLDPAFFTDTVRPLIKRFENLRITGYMQPQFQVAQEQGAQTYSGGNFPQFSKSRFMLRRARVKIDYLLSTKNKLPQALFSFQIDATERGVIVRDMFVRLYETKTNSFYVSAGLFARPFGFEVNLSSTFRETPERGRMSQILMPSERDLGLMLSFEPQEKKHKLNRIKLDAGFFNGQGLSGTADFDSHKDFISRLTVKPHAINNIEISGGGSILRGGWKQATKYVYRAGSAPNGDKIFIVDSAETNLGRSSPRHYYGADAQVKLNHNWGETEWRAEYWWGTQPGTENSTTNPGTLPTANGIPLPTYIRNFNGAFFYFLQHIISVKHQLLVKYDWYDPNTKVEETEIGKPGTNLTAADIKYSTLGLGYVYQFNPQTKIIFYYDIVKNENTNLASHVIDLKDNVFTCRLQFRF